MGSKINERTRKNVIYYRKQSGLTSADLASKLGVSHDFIRQAESKKIDKHFSIKRIEEIADLLKIDYAQLFEKR